jgi:hypothetical protein
MGAVSAIGIVARTVSHFSPATQIDELSERDHTCFLEQGRFGASNSERVSGFLLH